MGDHLAGVDPAALDRWFADHVAGAEPPLSFQIIAGGHSNITYRVTDRAGRAFVLRRPPLGHVLATAHDMAREHRIISALAPTPVPVAPALALCPDESVNGAPFYVMAFVEGHVLATADDVEQALPDADTRLAAGHHVVDNLADLHRVDVDAVGLGDLARRDGYVQRQLRRWRGQWEQSRTRDLPAMEEAYRLLAEREPAQRHTGIVHGDYRVGNMITGQDGRIAAVLDWELCTLGDVLADVGYVLNNWGQPGEPIDGLVDPPPTAAGGFGSREDFVARYAARTGFDVSEVDYYRAFSYWRSAAILEGVKRRYIEGVMVDETFPVDIYDERVGDLAELALERIRALALLGRPKDVTT
jgi:aminoglycoside phosphotransferase (APT) family kinase protein